ncbi:CBP80/20-dependent translation initiation factor isoform X3 [Felis catus]|uniref:CBP80/20-dependent translation initiation factor isoform X3 n=1 Tax=Felis catus TaxID=9685 RepID=UPI001D1A075C|nr:CBP80/20-dependent translation initiation factor isoform X3 [Felis catus]
MENSSAASASSEAGSSRSQEIEELERFIDSYVLEYQVQGLLADKTEGDGESEQTQSHISQWTADCSEQLDSSCSFSRGRAPAQQNGSKDNSLDMLGTDIWAANTFDSFSGATWDLQPEKLDFTQFHRKLRHTPKPTLPHIDREGCGKGKLEDGDGINLNDIEKVLPAWQGYHPMPHEVEIAHTKKLFRRRRNDRRRQQRPPGGNKPQQHGDHQPVSAKHNRDHQKSYQGGSVPHPSGRPTHHGYSQNRRWHHSNMKHPPGDKGEAGAHRNAKETVTVESPKLEDALGDTGHGGLEPPRSPDAPASVASERLPPPQPGGPEAETKRKDSIIPERIGERPKITLLQSSKDRLRRRLKEKVPDEVAVETTNPQQNKMDKLIEILNSMRNNSSDVDAKLTTFMEEAQNSTNSEEMLGEIVRTIYQKAVSDRSFAFTAAKLCDKMALFMVEGTKFRSLLLNMLQGQAGLPFERTPPVILLGSWPSTAVRKTLQRCPDCATVVTHEPAGPACHPVSQSRNLYQVLDSLLSNVERRGARAGGRTPKQETGQLRQSLHLAWPRGSPPGSEEAVLDHPGGPFLYSSPPFWGSSWSTSTLTKSSRWEPRAASPRHWPYFSLSSDCLPTSFFFFLASDVCQGSDRMFQKKDLTLSPRCREWARGRATQ